MSFRWKFHHWALALSLACGLALYVGAPTLPVYAETFVDCASQSYLPETECDALVALYNSAGGDDWIYTEGKIWLEYPDPCEWEGVTCSVLDHVTELYLKRTGLTGTLPSELGNLSQLTKLSLYQNSLTGPIPASLGNLSWLTYLGLNDNQLNGSIPAALGNLVSLKELYLYNNTLSGSLPPELGNLDNLDYLHIYQNDFNGPVPLALTQLVDLEEFYFYDTRLCEPDDAAYLAWKNGLRDYQGTGVCQMAYARSSGPYDGKVIESSENSNLGGTINRDLPTLMVGDTKTDHQAMSILHFNSEALPDDAVVSKVSLRVRKSSLAGADPTATHGYLIVDIDRPYFGTQAGLQALDFQDTASLKVACTLRETASGWFLCSLKGEALQFINRAGFTQFRLRFQLGDNDDLRNNLLYFYSGDVLTADWRPILTVQYYVPPIN